VFNQQSPHHPTRVTVSQLLTLSRRILFGVLLHPGDLDMIPVVGAHVLFQGTTPAARDYHRPDEGDGEFETI
jgi:hypothetical protein